MDNRGPPYDEGTISAVCRSVVSAFLHRSDPSAVAGAGAESASVQSTGTVTSVPAVTRTTPNSSTSHFQSGLMTSPACSSMARVM